MKPVDSTIRRLAREVLDGKVPSRADLLRCASLAADQHHELLYWANRVRRKYFGDTVRLCSIGAGKVGACSEDCKWCAQGAAFGPGQTKPELATVGDLAAAAVDAAANSAASFGIVNSGRRPGEMEFQTVLDAAAEIRKRCGSDVSLSLCASLGELTPQQAAQLAAAGIRRYNHNLETSRRMYGRMVTTHAYDDRLATARIAKDAGMGLCCGGIFGIGETWADRIDLAVTLRDEIGPEVVPLNFLHPIPGTPLADAEPLKPREILDIIAVYRLTLPTADIKIAGGREANLRDVQSWMFYAGATSCLIGNYLTTPGRPAKDDLKMIADLGLTLATDERG